MKSGAGFVRASKVRNFWRGFTDNGSVSLAILALFAHNLGMKKFAHILLIVFSVSLCMPSTAEPVDTSFPDARLTDDFLGAGLQSTRWSVETEGGSVTMSQGLVLSTSGGQPNGHATVWSRPLLLESFTMEVEFEILSDLSSALPASPADAELAVEIGLSWDEGDAAYGRRRTATDGRESLVSSLPWTQWVAPISQPSDRTRGRLTLHRSAGTLFPISGLATGINVPRSPARLFLRVRNTHAQRGVTARFTNLTYSGHVATPAVEYHHAGFDHYFMTADVAEIEALDAGAFDGAWKRTGQSFLVYAHPSNYFDLAFPPVCRFFSVSFAPKSSHFYTANRFECGYVRANNPDWNFENIAFFAAEPAADGACPSDLRSRPVFRTYNNGRGGAPNHRFTVDPAIRDAMVQLEGFKLEGVGPTGAAMCVPY